MSLKELSARLGLSQTTISRALNGYPEVSEKTRLRVQKAAQEMHYRPNPNAKSLATGRTGHIGIILPIEQNLLVEPVFSEFLAGVSLFLSEAKMDITLMPCRKEDEILSYQQLARSSRVDGIIISSPITQDPRIRCLLQSDFPFIVHGRTQLEHPYPHLDIDNHGAFKNATNLLLDLGHERIGLINGDENMNFARDRQLGYRAALHYHHIAYDPQLVHSQSGMTEEAGFSATIRILLQRPRPTAFIVGSMIHVLGVMRAIRQHGLEPGRDISLIAHDDDLPYLQADKFDPPLTTTTSAIRQAGYQVAQLLRDEINYKANPNTPIAKQITQQTILPVELIVRSSTRARRK